MRLIHRRSFFRETAGAVGALAGSQLPVVGRAANKSDQLPVAAIVTTYYPVSHADVIVGKILAGYQHDGGNGPRLKVVSLYTDQDHEHAMHRELARKHGFRLSTTIADAITLGTDTVQVAGVLSIGEHGDYPRTPDTQQKTYPRRRFFDAIADTLQRSGKVVPVFNDKHFSYRWQDAKSMFDRGKAMKIPMLAGSSLPVTWRYPALELPLGCEIEQALAIGYGGLEDYGFHALETLQCMIERRRGGESGVASVRAVTGKAIRETETAGDWSSELFAWARAQMPGMPRDTADWVPGDDAAAYLMRHRDGLKSAVIMANGLAGHFCFAAKLRGTNEPVATWFKLQDGRTFGHFAYQVHAIEHTIRTGISAYPPERTLLTTGVLDRCMQSMAQGGVSIDTPELAIAYEANDWPFANHSRSPMSLPNDY